MTASGNLKVSGSTTAVTMSGGTVASPTTLSNSGTIQQTGTGRAVQSSGTNAILVIQNNANATISSTNNDTIAAGTGSSTVTSVSLTNAGAIQSAAGGQAVNFNKITSGTNSVTNSGLIKATGSDAVRPGINGTVTNSGTIWAVAVAGSSSDGIDAQNNTGVSITNNNLGLIEGGRHGITGGAIDNTVFFTASITNNSGGVVQGDNGAGINLDGFNAKQTATVVNHGTITGNGVTGDGDGIDVDGVINLTNSGVIRSIKSFSSTTPAQSEGVTVGGGTIVNSGTIEGLVAVGNNNAVGRGITIAGVDTSGTPEPIYAATTITNQGGGLIRGQNDSGVAIGGAASGFTVTINNLAGGTIRGGGATAATIQTGADNDVVNNAGSIINDGGNGKVAVSLGGGDDHLSVSGGSAVIVGGIDGGTGNNTLTFDLGAAVNAFSHSGAISNFSKLEVFSGRVTLGGANTYSGTTDIGGGTIAATLSITGSHTGGSAYTVKSKGTLTGPGSLTLANASTLVTIDSGGVFHPGNGRFSIQTGSLLANGTLSFDLNGPTAGILGGYDQLQFAAANTGTVSLGDFSDLMLNLNFAPTIGQQFELIDIGNSSIHISGHFAGLAEGARFTRGGTEFQITYSGGDGNDLVITAIPEPASITALLGLAVGGFVLLLRKRRTPKSQYA